MKTDVKAITDRDDRPVQHKRYNEVRGRRCSSDCKICNP